MRSKPYFMPTPCLSLNKVGTIDSFNDLRGGLLVLAYLFNIERPEVYVVNVTTERMSDMTNHPFVLRKLMALSGNIYIPLEDVEELHLLEIN